MEYKFKRNRSEFWVTIHKNDNDYHITTLSKYVYLIDYYYPILQTKSPTKWKPSKNYKNISNLWLPYGSYVQSDIDKFMKWCDDEVNDALWIGKNKNTANIFTDELDYCVALDSNYVPGNGRTELGEAEYQLKYNFQVLKDMEINKYILEIVSGLFVCAKRYILIENSELWCISPIPDTEDKKDKMAWQTANSLSISLSIPFIDSQLNCQKPQMKQLSLNDRINVWKSLYINDKVNIAGSVAGKNVIIFDDLYQSGVTMWMYARYLKKMGAKKVFGLVCVKALKDSDNI